MTSYDPAFLGKRAKELGFVRDTLEKVYRLSDILEYLNTIPLLKESLALKGGTAINLTIFNLPRLSVDIDLDYLLPDSKNGMLKNRARLNTAIDRFMTLNGYDKSSKTKTPHSLDSWVYEYINVGGNKDNIKLEVNYSLRAHLLSPEERPIVTEFFSSDFQVKTLAVIEIFGSKICAMLSRAAARDLYDVGNMIRYGLFDESEQDLLKKSVIFYTAVSSKKLNKTFDTSSIDALNMHKIRTDLLPVIRRKDNFNLEETKRAVRRYIGNLMILTESETEFLERFEKREYRPELLFQNDAVLARIFKHPMALWMTR